MISEREDPSVLIVLTGALGDVARGTVVPSLLKKARSELKITWLVEDKWEPIVSLCTAVDETLTYSRKGAFYGFSGVKEKLRGRQFDCVLDLQRHFKSGCFTWFASAPRKVGFSPKNTKEGNWFFQTEYIPLCDMKRSKVYHYMKFADTYLENEESTSEPLFSIDKLRAESEARKLLKEDSKKRICIALGSSWKSKDWVKEGYEKLLRLLLERDEFSVVLVGDKSQVSLGKELSSTHSSRVVDLTGKTSLVQLLGVLSLSDCACGPDTGTGHLASLVDTRYVGLFGPTDPSRVAPWGSESLVVTSLVPCRPCGRRVCPGLQNACMRLLQPSIIQERIEQVVFQGLAT